MDVLNKKIGNSIDFLYIKSEKFKSAEISVSFFFPISEEIASGFSLLISVLSDSCGKFKTFRELNRYAESIYGASICYNVSRMGNYHVVEISISSLDNRFTIECENNMEKMSDLICELIFNPLVKGRSFNQDVVLRRKKEVLETIDSQFSDKRIWSRIRCEQIMFENEKFGIQRYGTKSGVLSLDEKKLFDFYKKILRESYVKIMMISDFNCEKVIRKFENYFSNIERKLNFEFKGGQIVVPKEVKRVSEKMKVEQCKLVMGFRTPFFKPNDTYAMVLASTIFGGAPTSKLFMTVREKMNLCYYCSSSFNPFTGGMFVESGIESSSSEKAEKEILNQIGKVCDGELTDDEITEAKMYLVQRAKSILDNINSLHDWYVLQYPNDESLESPDNFAEEISEVSKDEVVNCMKNVKLDAVYILKN